MLPLPAFAPLSDFRVRQAEIIEKAARGPVVLLERGSRPALVAMTPELWNAIAEHLDDLEDAVGALRVQLDLAEGRDVLQEIDEAVVEDWLHGELPASDHPKRSA